MTGAAAAGQAVFGVHMAVGRRTLMFEHTFE
jgi:hypothetical protein